MRLPSLSAVQSSLARKRFRDFVRISWDIVEPSKSFIHNWHIDAIADHLEAVRDGHIRNLLINIPPGHAKSLIVSVDFPAWMWIENPGWRSLCCSYGYDLSVRDSLKCKALIKSEWYQKAFEPEWNIISDREDFFNNNKAGFRHALSVDGKGTGFRGDAIIVDDPLNAKDKWSPTKRNAALRWWKVQMSSRLNDMAKGAKIVIMQRLHEDDLAGEILRQKDVDGNQIYEVLILPSEYDKKRAFVTCLGFKDPRQEEGELLFPALFSNTVLEQVKLDLGASEFAGQHQQVPAPEGGGIFHSSWWRFYTTSPTEFERMALSVDCTFKESEGSDYVVIQAWGNKKPNFYLLEQLKRRMGFTETLESIREFVRKYPKAAAKYIEDKANGSAVIEVLRKKYNLSGVIAVDPKGGKESRAHAVSPLMQAGNIWLPEPSENPWVGGFIYECSIFPAGSHDDQVDAMTQLLAEMAMSDFGVLDYQREQKLISSTTKPTFKEDRLPDDDCPECGASCIAKVGNSLRCSQCGCQFKQPILDISHQKRSSLVI